MSRTGPFRQEKGPRHLCCQGQGGFVAWRAQMMAPVLWPPLERERVKMGSRRPSFLIIFVGGSLCSVYPRLKMDYL